MCRTMPILTFQYRFTAHTCSRFGCCCPPVSTSLTSFNLYQPQQGPPDASCTKRSSEPRPTSHRLPPRALHSCPCSSNVPFCQPRLDKFATAKSAKLIRERIPGKSIMSSNRNAHEQLIFFSAPKLSRCADGSVEIQGVVILRIGGMASCRPMIQRFATSPSSTLVLMLLKGRVRIVSPRPILDGNCPLRYWVWKQTAL
jgi:hypothetical protein